MERQLLLFGDPAPAPSPVDPIEAAFRRLAPDRSPTIIYAPARRRIFSWRADPDGRAVTVRVGTEFKDAPPPVAEAIVRIAIRRRIPRELRRQLFFEVRRWLATLDTCGGGTGAALPPRGAHVDLAAVLNLVLERDFDSPIPARIGWSERPARHLMGRYEKGTPEGLIVVNRLLDSPVAPAWYIEFLVFHELLHAVIPPRPGRSRILVHPPEFRRAERLHPEHARARLFERWACGAGFGTLLDPRGTGAGLPVRFR